MSRRRSSFVYQSYEKATPSAAETPVVGGADDAISQLKLPLHTIQRQRRFEPISSVGTAKMHTHGNIPRSKEKMSFQSWWDVLRLNHRNKLIFLSLSITCLCHPFVFFAIWYRYWITSGIFGEKVRESARGKSSSQKARHNDNSSSSSNTRYKRAITLSISRRLNILFLIC